MCRFAAYLGSEIPLRALVFGGTHPLVEQAWAPRELLVGSVNADGYGVVWYDGARPVRIARPEPVWYDPDLERLLEVVRGSTILAALRNATPGMPLGSAGLSPLVLGRWSFVFNGFIEGFREHFMRSFHERLPGDLYASLRGATDTEALFLMAVHATRGGADPAEALTRVATEVVEQVRRRGRIEAQMNMALTDGRTLAVSRASSVERTNSLYLAREPSMLEGGVVVASEALDDGESWTPVEPQTVVQVDSDGAVEVRPAFA